MKFEKALVTGGAGFIGSHLVEELVKNNVKVLVVDNLLTGKKSNIDKLENVVAIYDDLGSDESLKIIETFNPDICFHLAAQSSVVISVEDPLLDFEHNLLQPIKLLQKLIHTDCKKFVFSSSGGTIFGEPNGPLPFKTRMFNLLRPNPIIYKYTAFAWFTTRSRGGWVPSPIFNNT